jgi:hypothetical protein
VQHICRYPLLIREVHKHCPEGQTQDAVGVCQLNLIEVTTEINSAQGSAGALADPAERITLNELKTGVRFKGAEPALQKAVLESFERPTTQLMKVGALGITGVPQDHLRTLLTQASGKTYSCLLLNACLLVAERYTSIVGKPRFNILFAALTKDLGLVGPLEDGPKPAHAFAVSIIAPEDRDPLAGTAAAKPKKWVFTTGSAAERDGWIRNFEQALSITRGVQANRIVGQQLQQQQGQQQGQQQQQGQRQGNPQQQSGKVAEPGTPPQLQRGVAPPDSDDAKLKYGSLKEKNAMLQEAHPSFLLQMAKDDPLLNELQKKLQRTRTNHDVKS